MENIHLATIFLLVANILVSYKGFKDPAFFSANAFDVDGILKRGEHKRLLTSGFLHVNGPHLIFNMLSLYFFSDVVQFEVGWQGYFAIYFAALFGGNLLSLYFHRMHGDYTAAGASGAISGIVFAAIAMVPGMKLGLILIPIYLPAWIFAFSYILYTLYGIKSQRDNIGHEAHLGGGIIGIFLAIALKPSCLSENTLIILACLLPILSFFFLIQLRPEILVIGSSKKSKNQNNYSPDHEFRAKVIHSQKEIDRILEKIKVKGLEGLSKSEREALDAYAKRDQ